MSRGGVGHNNSKYQNFMLKWEHGRGNIQEIDSQFWQDMRPAAGQAAARTQFAVRDSQHREMRLRRVFLSAPVNAGLPVEDAGEIRTEQSGDGI
jgi:hypothetical protein